ncbi:MAG: inorganic phosphate transporter family protein [Gemmatimonadales bacterium]|nr:inorganic phosphate transporter family protein [Gemmatimonadales bacterium]
MEILLFLSSGLFLGWSLGANDAANVFGTAVGTRMIRFRTAAIVCSVFIVLGATISGAGAAHTLGRLGAVNSLAGSFTVALSAALTTFWMTRLKIPVSTSQAIVGAIIGWNIYSSSVTDTASLTKIMLTWVACPLISALVAVGLFVVVRKAISYFRPHLLELDAGTRLGLLVVGAFGSYSLGANNIANVMGVFLPDNPFSDISVLGLFNLTGTQQLFALGAVAIGVGVFTYSERVMRTVGSGLANISPVPALVIVLAQSITLFLFASEGLEHLLASNGLPTFPLVPVSSSQAVIGAILGLSLFKGAGIRYNVLGGISLGWVATPIAAGILAFFLLFFVDNVFDQQVSRQVQYRIDEVVCEELLRTGVQDEGLNGFMNRTVTNALTLKRDLQESTELNDEQITKILDLAQLGNWKIDPAVIAADIDKHWLTQGQLKALRSISGRQFDHVWQLNKALADASPEWRVKPAATVNKIFNKDLKKKQDYLDRLFKVDPASPESVGPVF